jgi:hypothetical protein
VNVIGVVLVLLALIAVAIIAYRAGYLRAQEEALRIAAVLPRWRRVGAVAAYGLAGLLTCLFLGLAFLYAKRWGWAVSLAAWAIWFALFIGTIWLAEWCWQPYRASQERLRQERAEVLKVLQGRDSKEDSA